MGDSNKLERFAASIGLVDHIKFNFSHVKNVGGNLDLKNY